MIRHKLGPASAKFEDDTIRLFSESVINIALRICGERDKLEKICRYIARPAVSEERLSLNARGEVVYKFKKAWDDGTTAIKMSPLEFIEKLVALIPRPRVHLTRFHGVLGPHYKYETNKLSQ